MHFQFQSLNVSIECLSIISAKKFLIFFLALSSSFQESFWQQTDFIVAIVFSASGFVIIIIVISYLCKVRFSSMRNTSTTAIDTATTTATTTVRFRAVDQTIHLMLPTYEDAIKDTPTSPPPTFEESEAMFGLYSSRGKFHFRVIAS